MHHGFQNHLESHSQVLSLQRYEVKVVQMDHFFVFVFGIFFSIKRTPNNMIKTHLESKSRGYNYCIMGKLTQKGWCSPQNGNWHWQTIPPKFIHRSQKTAQFTNISKTSTQTTKFINRLHKAIKFTNRLQKSDLDYKVYQQITKEYIYYKNQNRLQSLLMDYKRLKKLDIDYKFY